MGMRLDDDDVEPIDRPREVWLSAGLLFFAMIVWAMTPAQPTVGWLAFMWGVLIVAVIDFAIVVSRRYQDPER